MNLSSVILWSFFSSCGGFRLLNSSPSFSSSSFASCVIDGATRIPLTPCLSSLKSSRYLLSCLTAFKPALLLFNSSIINDPFLSLPRMSMNPFDVGYSLVVGLNPFSMISGDSSMSWRISSSWPATSSSWASRARWYDRVCILSISTVSFSGGFLLLLSSRIFPFSLFIFVLDPGGCQLTGSTFLSWCIKNEPSGFIIMSLSPGPSLLLARPWYWTLQHENSIIMAFLRRPSFISL